MARDSINSQGESTDEETRHEDEYVRDSGAGDPDRQPPPPPDRSAATDANN
jgi:hypothetical protein